jgi:hypothetical protein
MLTLIAIAPAAPVTSICPPGGLLGAAKAWIASSSLHLPLSLPFITYSFGFPTFRSQSM